MFHWAKIEGITIKRTLSILLNPKRYYSNATQIFKEEILEMLTHLSNRGKSSNNVKIIKFRLKV